MEQTRVGSGLSLPPTPKQYSIGSLQNFYTRPTSWILVSQVKIYVFPRILANIIYYAIYNNLRRHSSSSWFFLLYLQIDSKSKREGAAVSLKCCLCNFLVDKKEAGRQCPLILWCLQWQENHFPSSRWIGSWTLSRVSTNNRREDSRGVDSKGRKEEAVWNHYWHLYILFLWQNHACNHKTAWMQ